MRLLTVQFDDICGHVVELVAQTRIHAKETCQIQLGINGIATVRNNKVVELDEFNVAARQHVLVSIHCVDTESQIGFCFTGGSCRM
jgi:hypothetical protein